MQYIKESNTNLQINGYIFHMLKILTIINQAQTLVNKVLLLLSHTELPQQQPLCHGFNQHNVVQFGTPFPTHQNDPNIYT